MTLPHSKHGHRMCVGPGLGKKKRHGMAQHGTKHMVDTTWHNTSMSMHGLFVSSWPSLSGKYKFDSMDLVEWFLSNFIWLVTSVQNLREGG